MNRSDLNQILRELDEYLALCSKALQLAIKPSRTIRFPNIVSDAKSLGVSRIHLYFVLSGRRESPGLLRRYHDLKKGAA